MTFAVYYMPASDNPPPEICGFETEEDAWDYVLNNCMCDSCKREYENYLNGVEEDFEKGVFSNSFPACAHEWFVGEEL